MSARTAAKVETPEWWHTPFVEGGFTTRQAEATVRTGTPAEQVVAKVEVSVSDGYDRKPKIKNVLMLWTLQRVRDKAGKFSITDADPGAHPEMSFRSDEIEAFATALYEAVKLAKMRGYLPSGGAK